MGRLHYNGSRREGTPAAAWACLESKTQQSRYQADQRERYPEEANEADEGLHEGSALFGWLTCAGSVLVLSVGK